MERKINYRAQFRLVPITDDPKNRYYLLGMISDWINEIVSNEKYRKTIFNGIQHGLLDYNLAGNSVKVRTVNGNDPDEAIPKYFTLRFSHGESPNSPMAGWRTWINDIALEKIEDDAYLFSMSNSFQIGNGYIGRIEEPSLTSPNIIKRIVSNNYWTSYIGSTSLSLEPIEITHDNVKRLVASIFDPERNVPLVYISRDDSGELLVDPTILSKKLVGNSIVYYESDYSISGYLRTLPYFPEYRCSHGAIRVYLPKANYKNPSDPRRHRFYTALQIRTETPEEIIKIISESLVRRSVFTTQFNIQSIDDIERLRIEQALSDAIASKKNDKIIEVYKEQAENLKILLAEKDSELTQYCSLYDDKDIELDLLKGHLKEEESKNFALKSQLEQFVGTKENDAPDYQIPETIPTSLLELLDCVEKGYPNKIVVLGDAKDSAREFEIKDINKAYKLIKSIPEVLHELMFDGEGDKRASYKDATGFDLSMTESKMTKADKNLSKIRLRQYKGNEIDINAHVGYGNRLPNMLRIHFYISPTDKKIVIGHCGDHLENFSSRSMN